MTKKEATTVPPLLYMFERIMCKYGLFVDAKDWRELQWAHHVDWLKPLVRDGCIVQTERKPAWPKGAKRPRIRSQFHYYDFKVTAQGMRWWAIERTRLAEEREAVDLRILAEPCGESVPLVDGKGVGSEIQSAFRPHIDALVKGVREGYFMFVRYDWGNPCFWHCCDILTVALTPKGMAYFDSLPKLLLECA